MPLWEIQLAVSQGMLPVLAVKRHNPAARELFPRASGQLPFPKTLPHFILATQTIQSSVSTGLTFVFLKAMFLDLQTDIGLWLMQVNVRVRVGVPHLSEFNSATMEGTRVVFTSACFKSLCDTGWTLS